MSGRVQAPRPHRLGWLWLPMVLCFSFLYVPIVAYRLVTMARFRPVGATTRWVAVLELALLVASVALWLVEPDARP